jgi:hypothetical protein
VFHPGLSVAKAQLQWISRGSFAYIAARVASVMENTWISKDRRSTNDDLA